MSNAATLPLEPTTAEIEQARGYLEQAREEMQSATRGLSHAQWNYRPATEGWTIAQVLEHCAWTHELVLRRIAETPVDSAETDAAEVAAVDQIVRTKFRDRSRAFQAPEIMHPKGEWSLAESQDRFSETIARFARLLDSDAALRGRRGPSPPLIAMTNGAHQVMDGYQWIVAAAMHTLRHVDQIRCVQSESGFPAR